MKTKIFTSLVLVFVAASTVFAQSQPSTAARSATTADEGVTERGFKSRVFEIKHRDPAKLLRILQTLGSGFKGSAVSVNQEFKTITVRDFPENLTVIEDALKRLDTPEARRPVVEFRVHVLIASNTTPGVNDFPAELGDVIRQLQTTLRYKNYNIMTSSTHRVVEGTGEVDSRGAAESKVFSRTLPQQNPIFYTYKIQSVSVNDGARAGAASSAGGDTVVDIGSFKFELRLPVNVGTDIRWEPLGFTTPVSLREGERVVVGTTTLEDRGLVVVLVARVIR